MIGLLLQLLPARPSPHASGPPAFSMASAHAPLILMAPAGGYSSLCFALLLSTGLVGTPISGTGKSGEPYICVSMVAYETELGPDYHATKTKLLGAACILLPVTRATWEDCWSEVSALLRVEKELIGGWGSGVALWADGVSRKTA